VNVKGGIFHCKIAAYSFAGAGIEFKFLAAGDIGDPEFHLHITKWSLFYKKVSINLHFLRIFDSG